MVSFGGVVPSECRLLQGLSSSRRRSARHALGKLKTSLFKLSVAQRLQVRVPMEAPGIASAEMEPRKRGGSGPSRQSKPYASR